MRLRAPNAELQRNTKASEEIEERGERASRVDMDNSEGVLGYVKVPGRMGWKPAIKVCPRIVTYGMLSVRHVVTYGMLSVQFIY